MTKKPQDVTAAEFTVLSHLWEEGDLTTRQLADSLYPGKKQAAPTVLKLLERLEAKGFVKREDKGPLLKFSATIARDDLIVQRLNAVAADLCDGSRTPLLMHLVDPQKLSLEEIQMLRQLVSELDQEPPKKKRR